MAALRGRSPTVAELLEIRRLRHAVAAQVAAGALGRLAAQMRERERFAEEEKRGRLAELDRRLQEQAAGDLFNARGSFDENSSGDWM